MTFTTMSAQRSIEAPFTTYPESIKDEGELIRAKFHIWLTPRSGPAHPHVSSCHSLKFKVPLPSLYCIGPLHPKEADLVNAEPLNHLSCWGEGTQRQGAEPSEAPKANEKKSINGTIN